MLKSFEKHNGISAMCRGLFFAAMAVCLTGCGAITVRHVPKVGAISAGKMSDLRGSQPIDVKSGDISSEETKIGTVGMGKVVGKLSEWTDATVGVVKSNLSARGATVKPGGPKTLTITMTSAQVKAIPVVGGARSKILLTATTPDGLTSTVEGADSSIAPLGAVDGAVADAVKKLLADSAVDAYLRK